MNALVTTARTLVAGGKGLLAMEESNPTCNRRFAASGIPQTQETRRAHRELIVTTPRLGECIGGAILYDETIRQRREAGLTCLRQESVEAVAEATAHCFLHVVPAAVPGIAFLSGGQSGELASARLNAMNVLARSPKVRLPWTMTFSFARAIQQPALEIWLGQQANVVQAQQALYHRAECNRAALHGDYHAAMETT